MNEKIYFNEIKKYAYINYFQSRIIIFLQNHQHFNTLPPTLHSFFKSVLKKICILFLNPFPHCRLHLFNRLTQRLTVLTSTHWSPQTIPSLHTSPYPAPYCTHINTLITTNHSLTTHFTLPSALLYSNQHTDRHKQLAFVPWISIGGTFSAVRISITARCLNRTSENCSISMCTVWGL